MIDESQTYSDGTLRPVSDQGVQPDIQPAPKRKGGRVKGSKNKPKDKPTEPVTEAEAKSLREFIREITTGEEFRNGLKDRLKTGKLSPGESRLVEKILDAPVEKKQEGWQRMLAVATEDELVLLADLARRAGAYVEPKTAPKRRTLKVKAAQSTEPVAILDAETGATIAQSPSVLVQESQTPVSGGELAGTRDGQGTQELTNQVLSGSEEPRA